MREHSDYKRIIETMRRNILSLESVSDNNEALRLAKKIQLGAGKVERYLTSKMGM